jgi:hypothetical protein
VGFGPLQHLEAGPGDGSQATYYAQDADPLFTVHCTEPWGTCALEGLQIRIPSAAQPGPPSDLHMTVLDQRSGWEYDMWGVASKPAGGGQLNISWGGKTRIDGDGRGSDATAAQFGNLAGIIRAEELEAGQINHALVMAVKCDNGTFVYPATKSGQACSSIGLSNDNAPPMGAHLQLDMSDAQIAALPVPAWKKTVLTAMAHYGMYVGDTGGTWGVEQEAGATYTSFGAPDEWVRLAQSNGWSYWAPTQRWVGDLRAGIDWAGSLRVLDPCVAQGTC